MTERLQLGVAFGLGVVVTAGVGGLIVGWGGVNTTEMKAPAVATRSSSHVSKDTGYTSRLVSEPVGFVRVVPETRTDLHASWPETYREMRARLRWERDERLRKWEKSGSDDSLFGAEPQYKDPFEGGMISLEFPNDAVSAADAGLVLRLWPNPSHAAGLPSPVPNQHPVRVVGWDVEKELQRFAPRCTGPRTRLQEPTLEDAMVVDVDAIIASLGELVF
jgi:hypothetical protein